jgi:hypothetical protein
LSAPRRSHHFVFVNIDLNQWTTYKILNKSDKLLCQLRVVQFGRDFLKLVTTNQ